ncbi:MAG: Maf family protein [Pseudomonadota bacterium]|jgi:septum formation protein
MDKRIYLASRSPRRRELLKQIGVSFEPLLLREDMGRGPDVDESPHSGETAVDYVRRVARAKAEMGWFRVLQRRIRSYPVLTADTTVMLEGEILGKPATREQACEMLKKLSGKRHEVHTAVAMCNQDRLEVRLSSTMVEFGEIQETEIRRYVASGESMDKAGAYAIQGRAALFVKRMEGSYSGVMGLPLFETAELLRLFNYEIW